jgi:predicted small secreted protein
MKRIALIALVLVGSSTVAACHTVQGVGKDVTAVGKAGQDAVGGK